MSIDYMNMTRLNSAHPELLIPSWVVSVFRLKLAGMASFHSMVNFLPVCNFLCVVFYFCSRGTPYKITCSSCSRKWPSWKLCWSSTGASLLTHPLPCSHWSPVPLRVSSIYNRTHQEKVRSIGRLPKANHFLPALGIYRL